MLCGTCGGSGIRGTYQHVNQATGEHMGDEPIPCEPCAGSGVVIPDRIIEAAAKALDPFMVHPLEAEAAARAALVAAAKEQAKENL
jgi:hypothetical protein